MARRNPYDTSLDTITRSMRESSDYLDEWSDGVQPFDSKQLTAEEEALVYDHPASLYEGETDEQTGLPISNAQAAQRLLEDMGPVEYTKWVVKMDRRRAQPPTRAEYQVAPEYIRPSDDVPGRYVEG